MIYRAAKSPLALMALVAVLAGCVTHSADILVTPVPTRGILSEVARFDDQVTGVAVGQNSRIFVNFPRWGREPGVSVAELLPDGSLHPYPDHGWNRWDKELAAQPGAHFICVQSVFVDADDFLWILDPASPRFAGVVPGGAKLVKVDLASNEVEQVIIFDRSVALPNSYLNDVRIAPGGELAYITDSGVGGIVVADLRSGTARRVLSDHPSTRAEQGVVPVVAGRELRDESGKPPAIHADGIALDREGKYLYYHALTARTLYRIATRHLLDPTLSAGELGALVEKVAVTGPTDGMEMDREGRLYLTALEKNGIVRLEPDRTLVTLVEDDRVQWPDSISFAPSGEFYFTASQIHRMARFNNGTDRTTPPFRLFRLWLVIP